MENVDGKSDFSSSFSGQNSNRNTHSIDDIESKEDSTKEKKVDFLEPEEEVVSIMLSAMMGNIVETWQVLDRDESEVHLTDNASVGGSCYSIFDEGRSAQNKLISHSLKTEPSSDGILNNVGTYVTSEEYVSNISLKALFEGQKEKIFGWQLLVTNSEVVIIFKQGNRYEGRLFNCRMHGKGQFFWADGSVYNGTFLHGDMTGMGTLQWSDLSWYEGQFSQGYRHGYGLYIQAPVFYSGQWNCGKRHGDGCIYYHYSSKIDFYCGEWSRDCKDGKGLRSYPSKSIYSGKWKAGVRHGKGNMVWINSDIYSGDWDKGCMHGFGEYIWDAFKIDYFITPDENCYYGNWVKNNRHGVGTLNTNSGITIRGTWKNGKKHGPAAVLCSNGSFIYSRHLFVEDCISTAETNFESSTVLDTGIQSLYKAPVTSASQEINLRYYCERLRSYKKAKGREKLFKQSPTETFIYSYRTVSNTSNVNKRSDHNNFTSPDDKIVDEVEENLLRNIMQQYLSALKVIYTKYSKLCCPPESTYHTHLMRLFLWQLMRDCSLHKKGKSLAEFDLSIARNKACFVEAVSYPFEKIYFWQFLHCIIELSWELYGKNGDGTSSVQGNLASALHKLINCDILPNAGKHNGKALFVYRDFLSLHAVYRLYLTFDEPHSVRQFLKHVLFPSNTARSNKHTIDYPEYIIHGKNVLGVGVKVTYRSDDKAFLEKVKPSFDPNHPHDLTCLIGIGPFSVFNCLLEICPSVLYDNIIVNMDYDLVFLEFYEIILYCANLNAKKKISERQQNEAFFESVSCKNLEDEQILTEEKTSPNETTVENKKSSKKKISSLKVKSKKNK